MLLEDLLDLPGARGVRTLAGSPDGTVASVRLVTSAERLLDCSEGALAVLLEPCAGYRRDLALRDAAQAGLTAVLLTASGESAAPASATTVRIAARAGVCLLHRGGDPGELFLLLRRAVDGDPSEALHRIETASGLLSGGDTDPVTAAGRALGTPVHTGMPAPGEHSVTIAESRLSATTGIGAHAETATRAVLTMAAGAVAAGANSLSDRSRGQLIAELILAQPEHALRLAARARALGISIDQTHTVLRIEPTRSDGTDRYRVLLAAEHELAGLERPSAQRHSAIVDDALLVLLTDPHGPRGIRGHAERLLDRLRTRFPEHEMRCGVGTDHVGPTGIHASAREARSALQRLGGGARLPGYYDAVGLDRMLFDWYSSQAARDAVREQLGPLLELGARQAKALIEAMQSYLDHGGSPSRAARSMHLHRNAVSQRVRRACEILDVRLDDPEQRLKLQLACRAYLT